MIPIVSIIIPCFNSGAYLSEAIASVEEYDGKYEYEIIIVNDGSNDNHTLVLLKKLSNAGYQVQHKENGGPASARNMGVSASKGKYVLFLDSDNKIYKEFIDFGVNALEKDKEIDIVHTGNDFIGAVDKGFRPKRFDLIDMMCINYIDMCS
ncbi:MAG: glycosyltransferase family 2 protein, partial [Flavobacterium sp.]